MISPRNLARWGKCNWLSAQELNCKTRNIIRSCFPASLCKKMTLHDLVEDFTYGIVPPVSEVGATSWQPVEHVTVSFIIFLAHLTQFLCSSASVAFSPFPNHPSPIILITHHHSLIILILIIIITIIINTSSCDSFSSARSLALRGVFCRWAGLDANNSCASRSSHSSPSPFTLNLLLSFSLCVSLSCICYFHAPPVSLLCQLWSVSHSLSLSPSRSVTHTLCHSLTSFMQPLIPSSLSHPHLPSLACLTLSLADASPPRFSVDIIWYYMHLYAATLGFRCGFIRSLTFEIFCWYYFLFFFFCFGNILNRLGCQGRTFWPWIVAGTKQTKGDSEGNGQTLCKATRHAQELSAFLEAVERRFAGTDWTIIPLQLFVANPLTWSYAVLLIACVLRMHVIRTCSVLLALCIYTYMIIWYM